MRSERILSGSVLGIGIVAISFAAIFARLAQSPAILVAALRLVFTASLLLPVFLISRGAREELRALSFRDWCSAALAGIFLALHFILWISSLSLTSVASSVVLVTTSPIWIAVYSILILRERVPVSFWLGIIVAISGGAVIGSKDIGAGRGQIVGDLLAALGAVAVAGYFLVGSALRKRLSTLVYIFPVSCVAAVLLIVAATVSRSSLSGLSSKAYYYCFLMALVCQVIGHSLFNWALKYLKATAVAAATLGEPVGASLLAYLILGEHPGWSVIFGALLVLSGVTIVLGFAPITIAGEGEKTSSR